MIRKIIYITLSVLVLGGSIYLAASAGIEHRQTRYRSFKLQIMNLQEQPLITEEELIDTLEARFGKIEGQSLESVPIYEMEQFLSSLPYVSSTNVFATLNGEMSASVITRVPLVRVFNSFGQSFLIDTAGMAMPVSTAHPVRVPVASGNIDEPFYFSNATRMNVNLLKEGSVIRGLFEVSGLIAGDEFLNALIGQIYVNENHEIELLPKIGDQVILFGSAERAREKLQNLNAFYMQVVKVSGWNTYKTINLKFDNQVVCSK